MKKTLLYILFLFTLTDLGAQYLSHPSHEAAYWATLYRYEEEKVPWNYQEIVFHNKLRPVISEEGLLTGIEFSSLQSLSVLFNFKSAKGMEIYHQGQKMAFISSRTFKKKYKQEIKKAEFNYLQEVLTDRGLRRLSKLFKASGSEISEVEGASMRIQLSEMEGSVPADLYAQYTVLIGRYHANISQENLSEKRKVLLAKHLSEVKNDIQYAKEKLKVSRQNHVDYLKRKKRKFHLHRSTYFTPFVVELPKPVFTGNKEDVSDFSFVFPGKKFATLHAFLEPVLSRHKPKFRVVEQFQCEPFERLFIRKKMPSRFITGTPMYNYTPTLKKTTYQSTVQFGKGTAQLEDTTLLKRVKMLQIDSNYIVAKIAIRAFASIEGDSVFNAQLQRDRAEVYRSIFGAQQSEDIDIELDTSENWELFYQQIANTPLDSLLEYSQAAIKGFLEDKDYQQALEPLLAVQRKAEIKLFLLYQPTQQSLEYIIMEDYYNANLERMESMKLSDIDKLKRLDKVMAIRRKTLALVDQGKVSEKIYLAMTNWENSIEQIMAIYELKAMYPQLKSILGLDIEDRILKLYRNWYVKATETGSAKAFYPYVLYAGLDLVDFIYELILENELDMAILCSLPFPKGEDYRYIRIREWDFVQYAEKQGYPVVNCLDLWLQKSLQKSPEELAILNADWENNTGLYRNVIYSFKMRLFYDFLSNLLSVGYNGYPDKDMYEFDLAYLLRNYQLPAWLPEDNHVYDEETGYRNLIATQINELNKHIKHVCGTDFYGIMLNFHSRNTLFDYTEKDLGKESQAMISPIASKEYLMNYVDRTLLHHEADELVDIASFLLFYDRTKSGHHAMLESYQLIKKAMILGHWEEKSISFIKRYGPRLDSKWSENEPLLIEICGWEEWENAPEWLQHQKAAFYKAIKNPPSSRVAPSKSTIYPVRKSFSEE